MKYIAIALLTIIFATGCAVRPGEYVLTVWYDGEEIFPNGDRPGIYISTPEKEIHFRFYDKSLSGPADEVFRFKRKRFGKYVIRLSENDIYAEYTLWAWHNILFGKLQNDPDPDSEPNKIRYRKMNTPDFLREVE